MQTITFEVLGIAAPQGSKIKTRWGAMREANPRTMPWRQEVAACAQRAMQGRTMLFEAVTLTVRFGFPHPKSHYRTGKHAHELRDKVWHMTSKPDLSKLVRAVEDAMTGIVYRDDAQITSILAQKAYMDGNPRTTIEVMGS
jgi:crossover junction endodeoxyribonuclease RusA